VYPCKAQVTIGLPIQKRFNAEKYGCTRTGAEIGTNGCGNLFLEAEDATLLEWR
jgi:hypothetical protein